MSLFFRADVRVGGTRAGFAKVFAAPDDPVGIGEANALSLVIVGSSTPHEGKSVAKSLATDASSETLMRCRSAQRRFRTYRAMLTMLRDLRDDPGCGYLGGEAMFRGGGDYRC